MSTRILVAYVSPRGSTAGIAQAVGKELQSAGHSVDVVEMKSVSSLESYNAVVIGGPFYRGKVAGDVGKFIGRNREALTKLPLAAFGVGVTPLGKNPAETDNATKKLQKTLEPLKPVAVTIFAGKVDPAKLSFSPEMDSGESKNPCR